MTNNYDLFSIGFDRIANMMNEVQNQTVNAISYPPYNVKKINDNATLIEMALAGFNKKDIDITLENNVLKISGSIKQDSEDENNYLFKGIAERAFSRSFTLADTVEIKQAELVNGMLRIRLENMVPEKKAKKIDIRGPDEVPKKSKDKDLDYGYLSE